MIPGRADRAPGSRGRVAWIAFGDDATMETSTETSHDDDKGDKGDDDDDLG